MPLGPTPARGVGTSHSPANAQNVILWGSLRPPALLGMVNVEGYIHKLRSPAGEYPKIPLQTCRGSLRPPASLGMANVEGLYAQAALARPKMQGKLSTIASPFTKNQNHVNIAEKERRKK